MVKEKKSDLRREILAKRDSQSEHEICEKSISIAQRFLGMQQVEKGQIFFLYYSIKSEVRTNLIAEELLRSGKTVVYPRILEKNRMSLHSVNSLKDLTDIKWSIPEPANHLPEIRPEDVDAAIIPGIAFDRHRCRLGWGGGYYDRFLPGMKGLSIGLAFDLQLVDDVPVEDHDHPLDMIITETRVL